MCAVSAAHNALPLRIKAQASVNLLSSWRRSKPSARIFQCVLDLTGLRIKNGEHLGGSIQATYRRRRKFALLQCLARYPEARCNISLTDKVGLYLAKFGAFRQRQKCSFNRTCNHLPGTLTASGESQAYQARRAETNHCVIATSWSAPTEVVHLLG